MRLQKAGEYARQGWYTCASCGKSIKHATYEKMKRCGDCKTNYFIFTDDKEKDRSI